MLLAVHLLQVLPSDNVLDLWQSTSTIAAKSVVLAQALCLVLPPANQDRPIPRRGALHFNDSTFSHQLPSRLPMYDRALPGNLMEYVPSKATESRNLLCVQEVPLPTDRSADFANRLPFGRDGYDKVILDVNSVCEQIFSQEHDTDESRAPELHQTLLAMRNRYGIAYAHLLMTALMTVRVGGRVVYCAPSTAGDDHDEIVGLAMGYAEDLAQAGAHPWVAQVQALPESVDQKLRCNWATRTRHGWVVVPDREGGRQQYGPRYIAVLTKRAFFEIAD